MSWKGGDVQHREGFMDEVPCWQILRWRKGSRYYVAEVRQDLFGAWELARRWGRCGSRLGGERHDLAANPAKALAQLAAVAKRRQQRGYEEVNTL